MRTCCRSSILLRFVAGGRDEIGQEGVATAGSIGGGVDLVLVVALAKSETKCEFINSGHKASPAYSTNKPSSINMIGYILFSNGSGG